MGKEAGREGRVSEYLDRCAALLKLTQSVNQLLAVTVQSLSRVPLCNPTDCSPPGSSIHGISPARILEWVALPSPRDLLNPGTEPVSPELTSRFFTTEPPGKPYYTPM